MCRTNWTRWRGVQWHSVGWQRRGRMLLVHFIFHFCVPSAPPWECDLCYQAPKKQMAGLGVKLQLSPQSFLEAQIMARLRRRDGVKRRRRRERQTRKTFRRRPDTFVDWTSQEIVHRGTVWHFSLGVLSFRICGLGKLQFPQCFSYLKPQ